MTQRRARKKARKAAPRSHAVTLVIEDNGWKKDPATLGLIRRAARLALNHPPREGGTLTILLSDDARLRHLNRLFRHKDKPTNVLSFASRDPLYLGDIAIARGVAEREAEAQHKTVAAHAAHLAVHGILHLKGYDHAKPSGRSAMETVEILILSRLSLPNPYAPRLYTATAKALN